MARTAGLVLVLLASASIALGSPLCCLVGTGCCGTKSAATATETTRDCCSHCTRDESTKPAPKPCPQKKDCTCKHDVANHAAAAEHAPFVAVHDVPAVVLPELLAAEVAATSHRALPLAPPRTSHPLLL